MDFVLVLFSGLFLVRVRRLIFAISNGIFFRLFAHTIYSTVVSMTPTQGMHFTHGVFVIVIDLVILDRCKNSIQDMECTEHASLVSSPSYVHIPPFGCCLPSLPSCTY